MKKNEIPVAQNNDFDGLVAHIQQTQDVLQNNARLVINRHVTAKAWLTGYYIVEYEQKGADRAKYGEKLLKSLSERLGKKKYSVTTLKIYRQFYQVYSHLDKEVAGFLLSQSQIGQSVIDQLQIADLKQNRRGCHKSMAHPFRFSPFPRYGIEKKRFYLQQSPNFHKLGLCLFAKNVYLCRKLL